MEAQNAPPPLAAVPHAGYTAATFAASRSMLPGPSPKNSLRSSRQGCGNDRCRTGGQPGSEPRRAFRESALRFALAAAISAVVSSAVGNPPAAATSAEESEESPAPIRALYVTGGANHDYETHRRVLTRGISDRSAIEIEWTVAHQGDGRSDMRIPLFESDAWSEGYDLVLHHYCFPRVGDADYVERILRPHREGLPAVLLHATLPSFREAGAPETARLWAEFCGADYAGFGADAPLTIVERPSPDPAFPALPSGPAPWTTPKDELYLIDRLHPGALLVAEAAADDGTAPQPAAWRHSFGEGGARVFAVTFGDAGATVAHPRYLELVTQGLLWAADRLTPEASEFLSEQAGAVGDAESPHVDPLPGLRLGRSATTGAEASASSVGAEGRALPSAALDGDPRTLWQAAEAGPASLRIDLARDAPVASAAILWAGEPPQQFAVDGDPADRRGHWMPLGAAPATDLGDGISFLEWDPPRPLGALRLTVPATRPGETVGVRAIAAYDAERPPPGALLARREGSPARAPGDGMAPVGASSGGPAWRLRAGWREALSASLPRLEGEILSMTARASGEVFVARGDRSEGRVFAVDLIDFAAEGGASVSPFLDGRAGDGGIAWDGEWLYLLEGGELNAYRGIGPPGARPAANERRRIGRVYSLPSDLRTPPRLDSLQLAHDGKTYARWEHPERLTARDRDGAPVEVPPRAIVRFGLDGSGFESVLALEPDGRETGPLVIDERMRAYLVRAPAGEGGKEHRPSPSVAMRSLGGLIESELPAREGPASQPAPVPSAAFHHAKELLIGSEPLDASGLRLPEVHLLARLEDREAGGDGDSECAILAALPYRGGVLALADEKGGEGLVLRHFIPAGRDPEPPVDLDAVSDSALPPLIGVAGPVGLEAKFEVLRRKRLDGGVALSLLDLERADPGTVFRALSLLRLADHPAAFDAAAAVAGGEADDAEGDTEGDADGAVARALAFHLLSAQDRARNHPVFAELTRARDPALTVAMLEAALLSGTEVAGLDELAFAFAASDEEALEGPATRFLKRRGAARVCFALLDDPEQRDLWTAAFRALLAMSLPEVADGLRERFAASADPEFRAMALEAMVELAADGDGRGLDAEARAALRADLLDALGNPRVDREALFGRMRAAGIEIEDAGLLVELAKEHLALEPAILPLLGPAEDLPPEARPWLTEIAGCRSRDEEVARMAQRLLDGKPAHAAEPPPEPPRVPAATAEDLSAAVAAPDRGWELLQRHGCVACHNVHGEGPVRAPDIVSAALQLELTGFFEAVRAPSRPPGASHEPWTFELDNGLKFNALIEREDAATLRLRDTAWNAWDLPRARVRSRERSERPLVHLGVADGIDAGDFASIHAYLRGLGGNGH